MFLRDSASGNVFIAMNTGSANVSLRQGGNTKLTTTSTGVSVTGNVGIGTSSPTYNLDVQNVDGTSLARFKNTDSTYNGLTIASDINGGIIGNGTAGAFKESIYFQDNFQIIRFFTNGGERIRIAASGNVSIGTTLNAGFLLDVNGTARVQGNLTLGTGGYIYGDTTNPFIRLNNNFGAQFGYGTSYIGIGGAGYSFYTGNDRFIVYRTTSGMRIADNATLITDPQTDGLQAVLALTSTNKGFLPPRGTNAQMLAIASPATGLIFFDNTNNKLCCYDGATWQPLF